VQRRTTRKIFGCGFKPDSIKPGSLYAGNEVERFRTDALVRYPETLVEKESEISNVVGCHSHSTAEAAGRPRSNVA
jgi:hypothetical protein